jgi:hypothetical protein
VTGFQYPQHSPFLSTSSQMNVLRHQTHIADQRFELTSERECLLTVPYSIEFKKRSQPQSTTHVIAMLE